MGHREYQDTCDWCGTGTNKLQTTGDTGLCPSCCPDLDSEKLPDTDTLPSSWHHMNDDEREMWLDGASMEEVMEEHDWLTPPAQPVRGDR